MADPGPTYELPVIVDHGTLAEITAHFHDYPQSGFSCPTRDDDWDWKS